MLVLHSFVEKTPEYQLNMRAVAWPTAAPGREDRPTTAGRAGSQTSWICAQTRLGGPACLATC